MGRFVSSAFVCWIACFSLAMLLFLLHRRVCWDVGHVAWVDGNRWILWIQPRCASMLLQDVNRVLYLSSLFLTYSICYFLHQISLADAV
jgi:hypothetical protein